MTKFEPAVIPESEILGTALGWLTLWKKGDANTLRVTGPDCTEAEALVRLVAFTRHLQRRGYLHKRQVSSECAESG